jgi:hypothetical protein
MSLEETLVIGNSIDTVDETPFRSAEQLVSDAFKPLWSNKAMMVNTHTAGILAKRVGLEYERWRGFSGEDIDRRKLQLHNVMS